MLYLPGICVFLSQHSTAVNGHSTFVPNGLVTLPQNDLPAVVRYIEQLHYLTSCELIEDIYAAIAITGSRKESKIHIRVSVTF